MWATIRKFGLGYCDLPTMIWNVEVMLRVVAVKVDSTSKPISKFIYLLTVACTACYLFRYIVCMLVFVFIRCTETGDVLAGLLVVAVTFNGFIGFTKLVYILAYQGSVQSMVEGYLDYDRNLPPMPSTVVLMTRLMRRVKQRAILFWFVMMGNGLVYNLQQLCMPAGQVSKYDEHVHFAIPKFFFLLTVACFVCYLFTDLVYMLVFVFVRCAETGDVVAGIMVLSVGINSLIAITKLVYMLAYKDTVQSMVGGYLEYDRNLPPMPSTAALMARLLRRVKQRAMLFWIVMQGNGFVYSLQPLYMPPGQVVMYDEHVLFGLQYIFGISSYLVALINIVVSAIFVVYLVSHIMGLLIITAGYSEARMLALSEELRELWSDAQNQYRENFDADYSDACPDERATKEINEYIKQRLSVIAKSHAINIHLVKKIEFIFRDAIAFEFLLLGGALISDLLGGLEKTWIILPFALMQVGMDCYVGQKLIDASLVFEAAVYDSKWENFNVANMKTVYLILIMSQRPLLLSAGGVATLSSECFMALIKSIYSAYTGLRSTMQN